MYNAVRDRGRQLELPLHGTVTTFQVLRQKTQVL